ncbi:uncharacterized protein LODBEIA_P19540 [Lodderomyces beijingensis]|uniref:Pre-mRNA processing factor 4 (PRP4)-like domain-containing protein n=1 Tax=Lodderomyces beijingensis TaxID=1775926 RepID=A0ABP0ZKK7_9ASCO
MEFGEVPVINDVKVPDEDEKVKEELQKLGQPVFINGEGEAERRQRLLHLRAAEVDESDDEDDGGDEDEEFYTPGPQELYDVRSRILRDSLGRASARLEWQRRFAKANQEFTTILQKRRDINSKLATVDLYGSQVIPDVTRAVSSVKFSPASDLVGCGSWDGSVHVLSSTDLQPVVKLAVSHSEKVGALNWKPGCKQRVLLSGGNEGTINVWDITPSESSQTSPGIPIVSIKDAHSDRITSTLYHPVNELAISTSFDQTWKLWDVSRQTELYQQEGHSKGVFTGSIHPDGSLFVSGGLDGIIYVWDLRSGRALMPLQKHIQGIYGLDWSPNGHQFASASGDCSVKIWDMRKLDRSGDEIATIPAHTKLVSDVKFFQGEGEGEDRGTFLITSSYDGSLNIWSADNWIRVNSMQSYNDKIMSCDVAVIDSSYTMVSGGWDKSIRLWKQNQ